jgi:hypothetical protein
MSTHSTDRTAPASLDHAVGKTAVSVRGVRLGRVTDTLGLHFKLEREGSGQWFHWGCVRRITNSAVTLSVASAAELELYRLALPTFDPIRYDRLPETVPAEQRGDWKGRAWRGGRLGGASKGRSSTAKLNLFAT